MNLKMVLCANNFMKKTFYFRKNCYSLIINTNVNVKVNVLLWCFIIAPKFEYLKCIKSLFSLTDEMIK